jgi:hypothetical protein
MLRIGPYSRSAPAPRDHREDAMGIVIRFPAERRMSRNEADARPHNGPASIVILPVVRIERHGDGPAAALASERELAAQ